MHSFETNTDALDDAAATIPNRLREMAASERPQERLARLGGNALSDTELLAVLLRSGVRGHDVVSLAAEIMARAGTITTLIAWRESDFRRFRGIGRVKALQLMTALEFARRVLIQQVPEAPKLNEPAAIARHLEPFAHGLQVEKFWVLCLDRKNRLLRRSEITSGTANAALAHPREVYREAVREGASAIVCVHNHPSGDPLPSAADLQVTRQLRDAAVALDIALLDHVILGRKSVDPAGLGYYSFRVAGIL